MTRTSLLECFTCGTDSRFNAMALTKPNQQLHRDLKEATALLKWSGVDLKQAAVKLSDAGQEDDARELIAIAMRFQEVEELMDGYADEVKAGQITRSKSN